jgi:hypothetical protein
VIPYLRPETFSFAQATYKPEADESQALVRPDKSSRRPAPSLRRRHYSSSVAATVQLFIRWISRSVKRSKSDSI